MLPVAFSVWEKGGREEWKFAKDRGIILLLAVVGKSEAVEDVTLMGIRSPFDTFKKGGTEGCGDV